MHKHYIALDHFHKTGLGTVGPASGSFPLEDHDAKVLLERGLIKEAKETKLNAALPDKKANSGAPENKKRDTKAAKK